MNIPRLPTSKITKRLPRLFSSTKVQIKELRKVNVQLQAAIDGLVNKLEYSADYTGNAYKTYSLMVGALSDKYRGTADWGCMTAKNIIDVRAAFVIGQGVKVLPREGVTNFDRELKFIKEFIEYNNLDEEVPQEWAKESEIEGKVLLRLIPKKADKQIRVILVPWKQFSYTVFTDTRDFEDYRKVEYKPVPAAQSSRATKSPDKADVILKPSEFVYKRFGGRSYEVNETPSKTALVLRAIEDLDKCMVDWRKINHLFSAPTPVIKCENAREAKQITEQLDTINWRIGKLLITSAEFSLVGWLGEGYSTLKEEMIGLVKNISGATGVPVHFLGFPDLLSNRATAENLMELIALSTSKERHIWIGGFEELFSKAITMMDAEMPGQGGMNPNAVTADIPFVSGAKMKELAEVWLPIYVGGGSSLEAFLSHVPDIDDIAAEAEKIKAQKEAVQINQNANAQSGDERSDQ